MEVSPRTAEVDVPEIARGDRVWQEVEAYFAALAPRIHRFAHAFELLSGTTPDPAARIAIADDAARRILTRLVRFGPRKIPSVWRMRVATNLLLSRDGVSMEVVAESLHLGLGLSFEAIAPMLGVPASEIEARVSAWRERELGLTAPCDLGRMWVDRLAGGDLRGGARARAWRHAVSCRSCGPRVEQLRARRESLLGALDASLFGETEHRSWRASLRREYAAIPAASRSRLQRALRARAPVRLRPSRWLLVGLAVLAAALAAYWVTLLR